jgi:CRISPR-associated protein Csm2
MDNREHQKNRQGEHVPPGKTPTATASKKIHFWVDKGKGQIDPKLFSETAERLAGELADDWRQQSKLNKRSQIRKFYDEVLRLNSLAQSSKVPWDAVLPQVHMLVAKTAYARGRELVSENFKNFMQNSVSQVEKEDDLRVFADFFEALMGFYRLLGPKN